MRTIGYINVSMEVWGGILSIILLSCLVVGGSINDRTDRLFARILVCNAVLLLSDAGAWLLKGHDTAASYLGVRVCNFLVFAVGYVLMALFTDYLLSYLSVREKPARRISWAVWGLCALAVILVVVSQYNHMYYTFVGDNVYRRGQWFWLSQVWGILSMAFDAGLLVCCRRRLSAKELAVLLSYVFLPAAALVIQAFFYGVALLHLASTISIIFVYISIQANQAQKRRLIEMEVEQARMAVVVGQIQPHFLYNALTTIMNLCYTDGEQAGRAVASFAKYLRGNLDSLSNKEPIPFDRELEHLQSYLAIEQLRFPQVRIVFDIEARAFRLPPLTLQPLVENAVLHGLNKRKGGGTVTVSSRETPAGWTVVVRDDGVGFSPGQQPQDGRAHIGLCNTTQRLQALCGGTLTVESAPGAGTAVTITIPKEAPADEGHLCGR